MQGIYAITQSKDDSLEKQNKFLKVSIDNTYTLYLLLLGLLIELRNHAKEQVELSSKKYLETNTDNFPDKNKFVNNQLLTQLSNNKQLQEELKKRKLNNWYLNGEYVKLIFKEIQQNTSFVDYMSSSKSNYDEDKTLIIDLYKSVIAPNDKIYDYLEDDKLTWVDDIPIVNTFIVKLLKKASENKVESFFLPSLLKDDDDLVFAKQLLSKTLLNNETFVKEIEGKTPNWDKDRIADIDSILLKMAICELLHFASIPERVTINEYLEIAKEYSTPKSSIFINGVLDKLVKEYQKDGKLKKAGRGLL